MYVSVCAIISCEQNIAISYEKILMKFCGEVGHGPCRNLVDFGGHPISFLDPGSFFRILEH